jgi:HEAT repeat protein
MTIASRLLPSLLLLLWVPAYGVGAEPPELDPVVDWAAANDPKIVLPTVMIDWSPDLPLLWKRALEHQEADVQREAADAIARAHQLGMPVSPTLGQELSETLVKVLEEPDQHVVARAAAARALVQIDARQTAELLSRHATRGPLEVTQIVEPALAHWDFQPQRDVWLQRLSQGARPALLQLAFEGLAVLGEERAIADLTRLSREVHEPATKRLSAARALATIQRSGLEELAGQLAKRMGPTSLVDRLVAASLLSQHSGEATLALLDSFADDPEPSVAAQAMQRLLELAPQRLIARAEASLAHRDARIRELTLAALATDPSPESIARIAPLLDDPIVQNRTLARRTLLTMAGDERLHPVVVEHTTAVLMQDAWRGDQQAILILTTLEQRQVGPRYLALLEHSRPEVFVTAAWGLRKFAIPDLVEPMFAAAQKYNDQIRPRGMSPSYHADLLAHLHEALGILRHAPAGSHLRTYVPKGLPDSPRAAAVWSLGLLLQDMPDATLASQLEERLADVSSLPPESPAVRAMCAVTLGRMKSESSLPVLRKWYEIHTHNDHVGRCCGWAIEQITGEKLPDPDVKHIKVGDWFLEPLDPPAAP